MKEAKIAVVLFLTLVLIGSVSALFEKPTHIPASHGGDTTGTYVSAGDKTYFCYGDVSSSSMCFLRTAEEKWQQSYHRSTFFDAAITDKNEHVTILDTSEVENIPASKGIVAGTASDETSLTSYLAGLSDGFDAGKVIGSDPAEPPAVSPPPTTAEPVSFYGVADGFISIFTDDKVTVNPETDKEIVFTKTSTGTYEGTNEDFFPDHTWELSKGDGDTWYVLDKDTGMRKNPQTLQTSQLPVPVQTIDGSTQTEWVDIEVVDQLFKHSAYDYKYDHEYDEIEIYEKGTDTLLDSFEYDTGLFSEGWERDDVFVDDAAAVQLDPTGTIFSLEGEDGQIYTFRQPLGNTEVDGQDFVPSVFANYMDGGVWDPNTDSFIFTDGDGQDQLITYNRANNNFGESTVDFSDDFTSFTLTQDGTTAAVPANPRLRTQLTDSETGKLNQDLFRHNIAQDAESMETYIGANDRAPLLKLHGDNLLTPKDLQLYGLASDDATKSQSLRTSAETALTDPATQDSSIYTVYANNDRNVLDYYMLPDSEKNFMRYMRDGNEVNNAELLTYSTLSEDGRKSFVSAKNKIWKKERDAETQKEIAAALKEANFDDGTSNYVKGGAGIGMAILLIVLLIFMIRRRRARRHTLPGAVDFERLGEDLEDEDDEIDHALARKRELLQRLQALPLHIQLPAADELQRFFREQTHDDFPHNPEDIIREVRSFRNQDHFVHNDAIRLEPRVAQALWRIAHLPNGPDEFYVQFYMLMHGQHDPRAAIQEMLRELLVVSEQEMHHLDRFVQENEEHLRHTLQLFQNIQQVHNDRDTALHTLQERHGLTDQEIAAMRNIYNIMHQFTTLFDNLEATLNTQIRLVHDCDTTIQHAPDDQLQNIIARFIEHMTESIDMEYAHLADLRTLQTQIVQIAPQAQALIQRIIHPDEHGRGQDGGDNDHGPGPDADGHGDEGHEDHEEGAHPEDAELVDIQQEDGVEPGEERQRALPGGKAPLALPPHDDRYTLPPHVDHQVMDHVRPHINRHMFLLMDDTLVLEIRGSFPAEEGQTMEFTADVNGTEVQVHGVCGHVALESGSIHLAQFSIPLNQFGTLLKNAHGTMTITSPELVGAYTIDLGDYHPPEDGVRPSDNGPSGTIPVQAVRYTPTAVQIVLRGHIPEEIQNAITFEVHYNKGVYELDAHYVQHEGEDWTYEIPSPNLFVTFGAQPLRGTIVLKNEHIVGTVLLTARKIEYVPQRETFSETGTIAVQAVRYEDTTVQLDLKGKVPKDIQKMIGFDAYHDGKKFTVWAYYGDHDGDEWTYKISSVELFQSLGAIHKPMHGTIILKNEHVVGAILINTQRVKYLKTSPLTGQNTSLQESKTQEFVPPSITGIKPTPDAIFFTVHGSTGPHKGEQIPFIFTRGRNTRSISAKCVEEMHELGSIYSLELALPFEQVNDFFDVGEPYEGDIAVRCSLLNISQTIDGGALVVDELAATARVGVLRVKNIKKGMVVEISDDGLHDPVDKVVHGLILRVGNKERYISELLEFKKYRKQTVLYAVDNADFIDECGAPLPEKVTLIACFKDDAGYHYFDTPDTARVDVRPADFKQKSRRREHSEANAA